MLRTGTKEQTVVEHMTLKQSNCFFYLISIANQLIQIKFFSQEWFMSSRYPYDRKCFSYHVIQYFLNLIFDLCVEYFVQLI